jgi:hypothetical protein
VFLPSLLLSLPVSFKTISSRVYELLHLLGPDTMVQINNTVLFFLLVVGTVAHPGANILHEVRERELALKAPNRRTVEDCRVELEASGYYKRELHRRLNRVNNLRAEKGSTPRK